MRVHQMARQQQVINLVLAAEITLPRENNELGYQGTVSPGSITLLEMLESMAQLLSASEALLNAVSLFASPGWQSSDRNRFKHSELRLELGSERQDELLELLRQTFGLEPSSPLWEQTLLQLINFGEALDAFALHTRTYKATPEQVLWVSFAFDFAPSLGRTWGFWCQDEPLLPNLPDDNLWFLPHADAENPDRLILPVETILSWWLEQIDGPLDQLWSDEIIERESSFKNWKSGRTTPKIAKVNELFADDQKFPYKASAEKPLTTPQLRSLLLWARAIEQGYKNLVKCFSPKTDPHDADPSRNKTLQLIELFRWSHQITMSCRHPSDEAERRIFSEALSPSMKNGLFYSIAPNEDGMLPAAEQVAKFLTLRFKGLPCDGQLPDIFEDMETRSLALWKPDSVSLEKRHVLQEQIQEVLEVWKSDHPDRQYQVAVGISKILKLPGSTEFEPDIEYLRALNALSSGKLEEAKVHAENAFDLCARDSVGPLKLEIAKLSFAFSVADEAFNIKNTERSFRMLCRSVHPEDAMRWQIGDAPIDYSMRLAAADHASWFWQEMVRPYEGTEIEVPLQENSEIIGEYSALLVKGASEAELSEFKKTFRKDLKRKLPNIRGDTFFTVTTKMVSDLVKGMRKMPAYSGMPQKPADMAKAMTATHQKLIGLLPVDVLNASDYLGQTALMLAADDKNVEMVEVLLKCGVDFDAQDALGRTALHSATKVGATQIVEMLFEKGANPTKRTCNGKTPAIFAAEFGRADIFQMRLTRHPLMGRDELQEVLEIAQDSVANFKAKRKEYAKQGFEIAGRNGFERIAKLSAGQLASLES